MRLQMRVVRELRLKEDGERWRCDSRRQIESGLPTACAKPDQVGEVHATISGSLHIADDFKMGYIGLKSEIGSRYRDCYNCLKPNESLAGKISTFSMYYHAEGRRFSVWLVF